MEKSLKSLKLNQHTWFKVIYIISVTLLFISRHWISCFYSTCVRADLFPWHSSIFPVTQQMATRPRCVGVNTLLIRPELALISFQRHWHAADTPAHSPRPPTLSHRPALHPRQIFGEIAMNPVLQTHKHTHMHAFVLLPIIPSSQTVMLF